MMPPTRKGRRPIVRVQGRREGRADERVGPTIVGRQTREQAGHTCCRVAPDRIHRIVDAWPRDRRVEVQRSEQLSRLIVKVELLPRHASGHHSNRKRCEKHARRPWTLCGPRQGPSRDSGRGSRAPRSFFTSAGCVTHERGPHSERAPPVSYGRPMPPSWCMSAWASARTARDASALCSRPHSNVEGRRPMCAAVQMSRGPAWSA